MWGGKRARCGSEWEETELWPPIMQQNYCIMYCTVRCALPAALDVLVGCPVPVPVPMPCRVAGAVRSFFCS